MNQRNFEPHTILSRVTFAYNQGEEVFRDVSLDIIPGDFCFLTGESGAGKSTLLKILYGAHQNFIGNVQVMGHNLKTITKTNLYQVRQKIGIMFQEFHLLEHLNVLDNVAVPLILQGTSVRHARNLAQEVLSWLGLGSYLHRMPRTMSGGQRQRITAGRAVVADPDLIIADEPTCHVDDENAVLLIRLLKEINQCGKTILIATHNQTLIDHYPGRHLHLHCGKLQEISAGNSAKVNPHSDKIYAKD